MTSCGYFVVMDLRKLWNLATKKKGAHYSPDRNSKGRVNFRNFNFLPPISIYYNPSRNNPFRNLKNNFETFRNVALILSNSCRFWVYSNFIFEDFIPPTQLIMTPQFMISQRFSHASQLLSPPPHFITVGRVRVSKRFSSSTI